MQRGAFDPYHATEDQLNAETGEVPVVVTVAVAPAPATALVLAILTGKPRVALNRRRDVVLDLCAANPDLVHARSVQVRVALLADLTAHGPFKQVFRTPHNPDRPVDWLGNAGERRR